VANRHVVVLGDDLAAKEATHAALFVGCLTSEVGEVLLLLTTQADDESNKVDENVVQRRRRVLLAVEENLMVEQTGINEYIYTIDGGKTIRTWSFTE
jgi:hypothetical protein